MSDILKDGLKILSFSDEQVEIISPKIEQYIKELILFNSAYNLVNTDNHDEIVIRHILDSLSAVSQLKELVKKVSIQKKVNKNDSNDSNDSSEINKQFKDKIIIGDIGSGGGLPGIPLGIAMPECKFVLVERMSKRCAFLENVVAILGLTNVAVMNVEAEQVKSGSIDIAVFRAFRPLDKKMIKTLLNIIPSTGVLAAYKAKLDKIKEEMSAINYDENLYSVIPLKVPFLTEDSEENRERNLVLISK